MDEVAHLQIVVAQPEVVWYHSSAAYSLDSFHCGRALTFAPPHFSISSLG